MRAVCGELNDGVYVSFDVVLSGSDNTGVSWTGDKTLVRGSNITSKGRFKSLESTALLNERAYLNYKDLLNTFQVVFTESKLAPLITIKIGLPNPDKYVVSEFFIKGHFEIEHINVINKKKTIPGSSLMPQLKEGKKFNLLDKLYIEYTGEPQLVAEIIETSMGNIERIRTRTVVEI